MASPPTKLYFGYGSNLWLNQMSLRCPSAVYVGVARLRGYRWIINSRGYANIVECRDPSSEVYGLVYRLTAVDEARLDVNEGVPVAYTKEMMRADLWPCEDVKGVGVGVAESSGLQKELLVYVDRDRTVDDKPKNEYVHRMNMGIKNALDKGVPQHYIDSVMRTFIPVESPEGVQELADRQALRFEDER
ncbi:MAG: hypothetical protein L6R39_004938 [Caloplaca ligustica]|nr:MAG: hypothetical protein L6R39_004938 [Caloplaca ligustica]